MATNSEGFFSPQTKNLDFRRKWDKDEYEKLAEKRLTEEREKKDGGCPLAPSRAKGIVEAMQWLGEPVGSRNALPSYLCKSPAFLVLAFFFFFLMYKMNKEMD